MLVVLTFGERIGLFRICEALGVMAYPEMLLDLNAWGQTCIYLICHAVDTILQNIKVVVRIFPPLVSLNLLHCGEGFCFVVWAAAYFQKRQNGRE